MGFGNLGMTLAYLESTKKAVAAKPSTETKSND
jgi:hypothetical protein